MKYILVALLILVSGSTFAARDVGDAEVVFVYQTDNLDTIFEFSSSVLNGCGSSLYRVYSPTEVVANRKFSLVLAAFTSGKRIAFHDREVCEGNRSVVAWVRIVNAK